MSPPGELRTAAPSLTTQPEVTGLPSAVCQPAKSLPLKSGFQSSARAGAAQSTKQDKERNRRMGTSSIEYYLFPHPLPQVSGQRLADVFIRSHADQVGLQCPAGGLDRGEVFAEFAE